jgi:hypothetical protein
MSGWEAQIEILNLTELSMCPHGEKKGQRGLLGVTAPHGESSSFLPHTPLFPDLSNAPPRALPPSSSPWRRPRPSSLVRRCPGTPPLPEPTPMLRTVLCTKLHRSRTPAVPWCASTTELNPEFRPSSPPLVGIGPSFALIEMRTRLFFFSFSI